MDEHDFDVDYQEKAKRVAKKKPSAGWVTQLAAVVIGLLLIMFSASIVLMRFPSEPKWNNVIPQREIGIIPFSFVPIIFAIIVIIFYIWCWRVSRGIAILLGVLHIMGAGLCLVGAYFWSGSDATTIITTLDTTDTSYVLVTRDIAGNGKLDLYRCKDDQCQGREIAWDEWATYRGATLTIAGDPPQLIVNALGEICFDLTDFDAVMQTYVTRPEGGQLRDNWHNECR